VRGNFAEREEKMHGSELRQFRQLGGLTQFQTATRSNVSRMKLSLAECGQIELTQDESVAVRRVLEKAILERAALMREHLPDTGTRAMST